MKKSIIISISLILVIASSPIVASSHMQSSSQTYQSSHVSFDIKQNAVVDYSVDGETVFSSMSIGSRSETESESGGTIGVGVDLGGITNIAKSTISIQPQTNTNAVLNTESGAQIKTHDNTKGILIITPGDNSQVATINISSSTNLESQGDKKVVTTKENGDQGTFLVLGNGQIQVNNQGNITANLESNSNLVFRGYSGQRTQQDRQQEQLISNQHATAEVYIYHTNNKYRSDIVQYSDTTVEVTEKTEGQINITADRPESQGKIILTTVSNQAIDSTNNVEVLVDGDIATQTSTYNELRTTIQQGQSNSKYLINQQSTNQATTDIAIAVNHFSERQITIQEQQDQQQDTTQDSTQNQQDQDTTQDSQTQEQQAQEQNETQNGSQTQPGFGVILGLIGLIASMTYIIINKN